VRRIKITIRDMGDEKERKEGRRIEQKHLLLSVSPS
jgi:hypothetical protein